MKKKKTKTELAHALSKSECTITRWMADGCPYEYKAIDSRRKRPMFDIELVRAWLESRTANTGKGVEA